MKEITIVNADKLSIFCKTKNVSCKTKNVSEIKRKQL